MSLLFTATTFAYVGNFESNGGFVEIKETDNNMRTKVTVDNGMGKWDYGTGISLGINKTVHSYLDNSSKKHKATCFVSTNPAAKSDSDWKNPRTQAKSNSTGKGLGGTAYVNWDVID